MTEAENIKKFLSGTRRELISVNALEKLAGVPKSTVKNFLNNQRDLPQHHLQNIVCFLVIVGYQPISDEYRYL